MKRAQIWISAVIYTALGIIVIALILAAAIPVVDKLKDRNSVAETKSLLLTVDDTIKIVSKEGPGSQRELSPLTINKGKLFINDQDETIFWQLKTSALILEPEVEIKEGPLSLFLAKTFVKEEYIMNINLTYTDFINLTLESDYQPPYLGRYSMLVLHSGEFSTTSTGATVPSIIIRVL